MPSAPAQLFRDAIARYGKLESYEDEGEVVIDHVGRDLRTNVSFETKFARPSFFRFLFRNPHPYPPLSHIVTTTICGYDGAIAYIWQKYPDKPVRLDRFDELEMAVAAATGISSGSAYNAWQLLIRGAREWDGAITEWSSGAEETVEGARCMVITGEKGATRSTLYLDADSLLARRVRTRFAKFTSIETRRDIKVDQPLGASAFTVPKAD